MRNMNSTSLPRVRRKTTSRSQILGDFCRRMLRCGIFCFGRLKWKITVQVYCHTVLPCFLYLVNGAVEFCCSTLVSDEAQSA